MISTILLCLLAIFVALLGLTIYRTRSMAAEAVRQVPQAGKLVTVTGGTVHYVDLGPQDAQPLVLIHGLSGQLQHFTYALAELLAKDYRVIAVDRPGCGYSTRDGEALADPSEQGRMIGEALDKLEIKSPVLVGHSLGGAVSLAMAMDRPDQVGALALLCPVTQFEEEIPEALKGLFIKSPVLRRLIGETIAVPMAAATRDKVLAMVCSPEPCPDDFMIRAGGVLGLRPSAFVVASEDAMALRANAEAHCARYEQELQVPGGVLFGGGDALLSPTVHGHTMQAHGLEYETLEGRGHMIPLTAPEDCAAFIRRMAARVAQD